MATDGKKLNQLPELTTLSDATMFYAVDGGEDYHVNFEKIKEETVPEVFTPTTDGLVPHPNSGNGGKVLRGDGTWQGTFDSSNDGLVPKLGTNDKDNVLRGDGVWVTNDKLIGAGSGSLVTFDAIEAPMPSLKVSVEAKQDLHGYDHPWVGGAGKNKLPMTVDDIKAANTSGTWNGNAYTLNGITFTLLLDGEVDNITGIKANGTASGDSTFFCYGSSTSSSADIVFSSPFIGSTNVVGSASSVRGVVWGTDGAYIDDAEVSFNAMTVYGFGLRVMGGYTIPSGGVTFKPMIRLSSVSDTTFAPYSNICPISGWDNAVVTDTDDVDNPTVTQTTTISLGQTVYGGEVDVVNGELKVTWKSVDMGSLTWSYSPTYTRFSSTGVQDEIKSGNNQDEVMCSCYGNESNVDMNAFKTTSGLVMVKDSRYTDTETFKQSVIGQQFVYMLETPIIVPLTPTLIKSLNGQNNLSVDCGEILEVEYQRSITEAINALENSGGGYSETSLWSNSSGVYTGSLALSDSIENYNALMFKVSNAQGWANFAFIPTSALASNNAKAGIGGGMQSAVWWFQFTRTDATHITINNNSSTGDKLYQIVGVKY